MNDFTDLVSHLKKLPWTIELEHALERFSIRTYLDWLDQYYSYNNYKFLEEFLNYLKVEVSNPCS